ncbi:hypothetical protein [Arthrobacter sp. SO3]|uniref:hypothetical protein n=1 Tax=Arthrobacter sp. SO3 TaxID=1897057 RepID=UPI001CFF7D7B|nr:hypothetical protein [Arthrobacter sp. SO3]MCB5293983.1 hypothetical protein [Arthrobacter sp. SO3]
MDRLWRGLLPAGIAGDRHGPYLSLNPFYVDGPAYGGLVGDVLDAGRFLRMHLRDGELDGTRILSPKFRRPTQTRGHWVEHFGAGAGFWNVMRPYPDRGLGIVARSNGTSR